MINVGVHSNWEKCGTGDPGCSSRSAKPLTGGGTGKIGIVEVGGESAGRPMSILLVGC